MIIIFCAARDTKHSGRTRYLQSLCDSATERGHSIIQTQQVLTTLLSLLWYRVARRARVLGCASIAGALLLTLPARILGMRVFWMCYDIRPRALRWSPLRPLLILMARLANVIVETEETRTACRALGLPAHALTVILPSIGNAHGWQTNIFGTLAEVKQPQFRKGALVLGVIAPLTRIYGIEYLLQAVRIARDVIPTIQCIIVGHGPERQQLQWLTERLDLKRHVLLVGWNEASEKWLTHFDILVVPTIARTSFDYSVLEAMTHGVPVISTTGSGSAEAIEPSKTGMCVEPKNPVMLAEAITNLYHHPDWRKEMGDRARERVRTHFSPDRMADAFETVITKK